MYSNRKKRTLNYVTFGLFVVLSLGYLFACSAPLPPTLDIKLDKTEYPLGGKVKIEVRTTNFSLSQDFLGKANKTGQGHYRVYLDNTSGNDFLVESGASSVEIELPKDINAGNHVLKVVLYNNDKTLLTPEVKETKTFLIKDPKGPSVSIKSTAQTVKSGESLSLDVSIKNFKLKPVSADPVNKEGEGHYHVVWDDANPEKEYQAASTQTKLTVNIPDTFTPGVHVLRVFLMNNNHTLYTTPNGFKITASINITVEAGTKPKLNVKVTPTQVDLDGIVSVEVNVENFKLVDPDSGAPNKAGEGHYRITLDEKNPSKDFLVKDIRPRVEVRLKSIPSGTHNIVVYLVNNDGSQLVNPVRVSTSIFIKGGPKPELTVIADKNKGLPGEEIQLNISAKNFIFKEITNGAKKKAGEGHYHIVFDDRDPEVGYTLPSNSLKPKIKIPSDLFPGKHKLWVYLMNNDHSLYIPETKVSVDLTVLTGKEPAVSIVVDKKTVEAGGDLFATVDVKNFVLKEPGGAVKAGEGHFHIVLGDADPEQEYLVATNKSPAKITLRSDIKPGKYKLTVHLMNNDHTRVKPPVSSFVTFEVTKP